MDKMSEMVTTFGKNSSLFLQTAGSNTCNAVDVVNKIFDEHPSAKLIYGTSGIGGFAGLAIGSFKGMVDVASSSAQASAQQVKNQQLKNFMTISNQGGQFSAPGALLGMMLGTLCVGLKQTDQMRKKVNKASIKIKEKKRKKLKLAQTGFKLASADLNLSAGQRPVMHFSPNRVANLVLPTLSQLNTDYSSVVDEALYL